MITIQDIKPVEISGLGDEKRFDIALTKEAFKILSDSIYSDKITAIIRELSCNAADSHVAAKNTETPFIVHLPNNIEPWFSVQDFGVGLSHDDVLNIFTTYFASTKRDSNDFTGTLGLGSKSPFAYTDTFTVTSIFNGTKRIYSAYISAEGFPTITNTPLSITDADEHNGVTISFSVKKNDFYEFGSKTNNVFSRFKILPTIVGSSVKIKPIQYVLHRNNWRMRMNDYASAYAVQGNVGYPIHIPEDQLTKEERQILELNIDIDFPIGQLDVAASRESLSYNTITINNIKNTINSIRNEIVEEFKTCVENSKNLWEARCAYTMFRGSIFHNCSDILDDVTINYKGVEIKECYVNVNSLNASSYTHYYTEGKSKRYHTRIAVDRRTDIVCENNITFLIKDITRTSLARIKQYMQANNITKLCVVTLNTPTALTEYLTLLGMPLDTIFQKVSELPYTPPMRTPSDKTYTANPKNSLHLFQYNTISGGNRSSEYWTPVLLDLNDTTTITPYVTIKQYKIDEQDPSEYFSYIHDICKELQIPFVAYGVKPPLMPVVTKLANWVPAKEYYTEVIKQYIITNNIQTDWKSQHIRNYITKEMRGSFYLTLLANSEIVTSMNVELLQNFCYKKVYKFLGDYEYWLCNKFPDLFTKDNIITKDDKVNLNKTVNIIAEKYPVLEGLRRMYSANMDIEYIKRYIKDMNELYEYRDKKAII